LPTHVNEPTSASRTGRVIPAARAGSRLKDTPIRAYGGETKYMKYESASEQGPYITAVMVPRGGGALLGKTESRRMIVRLVTSYRNMFFQPGFEDYVSKLPNWPVSSGSTVWTSRQCGVHLEARVPKTHHATGWSPCAHRLTPLSEVSIRQQTSPRQVSDIDSGRGGSFASRGNGTLTLGVASKSLRRSDFSPIAYSEKKEKGSHFIFRYFKDIRITEKSSFFKFLSFRHALLNSISLLENMIK